MKILIYNSCYRRLPAGCLRETWTPKDHIAICSAHFINNERSENPYDPSYLPTIFPNPTTIDPRTMKRRVRKHKKTSPEQVPDKLIKIELDEMETPEMQLTYHADTAFPAIFFPSSNNEDFFMEADDNTTAKHPVISGILSKPKSTSSIGCQIDVPIVATKSEPTHLFCIMKEENGSNTAEVQTSIASSGSRNRRRYKTTEKDQFAEDPLPEFPRLHDRPLMMGDDVKVTVMCGVSMSTFNFLTCFLRYLKCDLIKIKDKLTLFLMELRLGMPFAALGALFSINESVAESLFAAVLQSLAKELSGYSTNSDKGGDLRGISSKNRKKCINLSLKTIDFMTFTVEKPKNATNAAATWSEKGRCHMINVLLGYAKNGFINFKSKCYGSKVTADFIANDSGFVGKLKPGEIVISREKCSLLKSSIESKGAIFMEASAIEQEDIATEDPRDVVIYYEHQKEVKKSIEKFKDFRILTRIPFKSLSYIDDILTVICAISNIDKNFNSRQEPN
uniref:Uncharacterized protein n=1 Tax=Bracon brevicornis TaxID=1563983 RepID=A0A6V7J9B6_9HYME